MAQDVINNSFHVNGTLTAKNFVAPNQSITNAAIEDATGIEATKVIHQFSLEVDQAPGTAVVAATRLLHIVRGATAEVVGIEVATPTPATGADRTVTVDLLKGNAGSAFATILSGGVVLDDGTAARTPVAGTVTSPDLVAEDILEVTVAVAGAAGNQAQGLIVTVTLREEPT